MVLKLTNILKSNIQRPLNVLMVIPRYVTYGYGGHYVMPMGTLYVSAFLKKEGAFNVNTLNLNHTNGNERDCLARKMQECGANIIGIGGLSGEYVDIHRIVKWVKELNPECLVIVGGGIMTSDPVATMGVMPQVDFGIVGEGELTVTELLYAIRDGRSLEDVDGIVFRRDGMLVQTKRRKEIMNLDLLPIPDYEGFNYGDYLQTNPDISDEGKKYSQVSVIGGRSCKYNCTFCFHPSGTVYRQRSLESIFREIDWLVDRYDISYIALREELFATDNRRVANFCKRVEAYDFDWSIQLRIDNVNPELVNMLRSTRCRYIFVGVESANNDVLRSMRKGITVEQIEYALSLLSEAGLNSRSGVIFGDSAETYNTALSTLEWFEANRSRWRMFVDMVIAFPGSVLYKRAIASGVIPNPGQFLRDGCPIVNVSSMSDEEFLDIVARVEAINGRHYNVKSYKQKS